MIKRIISLVLIIVMLSSLFCTVAYAAVINTTKTTITPLVKKPEYRIEINLNAFSTASTNYIAYIGVYNKNNRMIELRNITTVAKKMRVDVPVSEYPAKVKVFIWNAKKPALPYCEFYEFPPLKSANEVIVDHLADFIAFMYDTVSTGTFMYKLNVILDEIDEDIIADARSDELIIDRQFLRQKYPDTYVKIKELANTLETDDDKTNAITALSNIINNYPDYKQLVITLFTLLDVYQYI